MANEEHLKILLEGVEAWNAWRRENREVRPDLTRAKLTDADLMNANLGGANLVGANLAYADLTGADLTSADLTYAKLGHANLKSANLTGADLPKADLTKADLKSAILIGSNLTNANLTGAYLTDAYLVIANLTNANLTEVDLASAKLGETFLANLDLTPCVDITDIQHRAPSHVSSQTLELTAASLSKDPSRRGEVETFLRAAGVPETIMDAFALMIANPIEFYSCFISYSHNDKSFARRLYNDLQAQGIRCWLDEKNTHLGDDIYDAVDRGIRLWDKVLLCCSKSSLTSWWVEDEINKAFEKERKLQEERGEKIMTLIPLDLDGYLFDGWNDGRAAMVRKRLAGNFRGWESDNSIFEAAFEKLAEALKTERDRPPESKL